MRTNEKLESTLTQIVNSACAMLDGRRTLAMTIVGLISIVVLSSIPALRFYRSNSENYISSDRIYSYILISAVGAVAIALTIKLCHRRLELWRLLPAAGVGTVIFFQFDSIRRQVGHEYLSLLILLIAVGASLAVIYFITRHYRVAIAICSAAAVLAAPNLLGLAAQEMSKGAQYPDAQSQQPRFRPNIYWVILDGYPRQDILKEMFGYDNADFLRLLETNGFAISPDATANFPVTAFSVSSTLNMRYSLAAGNGVKQRALPLAEVYPLVRGDNGFVNSIRRFGYEYVHFENGYDYLTRCGEVQKYCVSGAQGLDEFDIAFLSNTPIIWFLGVAGKKGKLPAFRWGAANELTAKLPAIWKTPTPFFLYAHVLAPHPPFRLKKDCTFTDAGTDLVAWSPNARSAFIGQIKCVERQTANLLAIVLHHDPGALVIIQSDHGSAFRGQFRKSVAEWNADDIRERFSVLSAMRLPQACQGATELKSLVDTFTIVLTCLTGEPKHFQPPRIFVTLGEGNAVAEYDPTSFKRVQN